MEIIRYKKPDNWIKYDASKVALNLVEAAASLKTLISIPYKLEWVEELYEMQLKREVAGTTKIEGAEFSQREFEKAISESPEELLNRSQRQASSAMITYKWISELEKDIPLNGKLILNIHAQMIKGADDDHCRPGKIRKENDNATFGLPVHRGSEGGKECEEAFNGLVQAISKEFKGHNRMIQALAAHYHIAAIHPFSDGNGRTARAVEAFLLKKEGQKDINFIGMSNYYFEEKRRYFEVLNEVSEEDNDLTSFLIFGLEGIIVQCSQLLDLITEKAKISLYKETMHDLFGIIESKRKRVVRERQIKVLEILLKEENQQMELLNLLDEITLNYFNLKNKDKAVKRDLDELLSLGAVKNVTDDEGLLLFKVNLEWPSEITKKKFLDKVE